MIAAPRFDVDELRKALVLGALAVRARRQRARELGSLAAKPHPLPDVTGQPVEAIVDAVFAVILAAHAAEWQAEVPDAMCPSCEKPSSLPPATAIPQARPGPIRSGAIWRTRSTRS